MPKALLRPILRPEQGFEVSPELLNKRNTLRSGLDRFLFMDENFAAFSFHQRPKAFTHAPPDVAQNLQAVGTRYQEGDAPVPQDSYGFGKAVECLQLEAGEIKALELFFREHREFTAKGREVRKGVKTFDSQSFALFASVAVSCFWLNASVPMAECCSLHLVSP
jgi:hypothetical protein